VLMWDEYCKEQCDFFTLKILCSERNVEQELSFCYDFLLTQVQKFGAIVLGDANCLGGGLSFSSERQRCGGRALEY
jgi:hypothetical protein